MAVLRKTGVAPSFRSLRLNPAKPLPPNQQPGAWGIQRLYTRYRVIQRFGRLKYPLGDSFGENQSNTQTL